MNRREFLRLSLSASGALAMASRFAFAAEPPNLFQLQKIITAPVNIASIDLLKVGQHFFVRSTSTDGAVGIALANERIEYLYPILLQKVIPFFRGKDARDLESLVDEVYRYQSNYKLAGLAFWCCVGYVEFSLFDLLGKTSNRPAGALLGGVLRREIPVYLSSLRRDTTPEQEVDWLGRRLAETNSKAVKLKIGGRMSRNADAAPGRTEKLIPLARKAFGDKVTIHVDANGSYDAPKAIEVGKMLEAHNVYFYEEPCPFEDFTATKRVADALKILIAGGEQDTSFEKFHWMIENGAFDIVQPDLNYNGGFIRAARIARLAAEFKKDITPHSPQPGFNAAYMLQFASATRNLGRFQEYRADYLKPETWFTPHLEVKGSLMKVPAGPGLGLTIDPDFLKKAEKISSA
jgi:L-alanine-DL-glutamate epimerase-like enolase superfamily enzyme